MSRRYARDRSDRRYGPKIQKITLSESHTIPKLIAAAVLLIAGIATCAFAFSRMVGVSSGWQEISVQTNGDVNLSSEFVLLYNVGASGASAGAENRAVSSLYTQACIDAYQIFTTDEEFEGRNNVCSLNLNPNTVLTVDEALYQAFETAEKVGSRVLYYAPITAYNVNLCTAETDADAEAFDSACDAAVAADVAEILTYVNDPDAVQIQLLGDNQVCLYVSEEYLRFAEEDGITEFIDFYRLTNAFAADYIADALIEGGYTLGTLSSYDGYTRCLYAGESSFNIYDRVDTVIYNAATASVDGMQSIVALRDFPLVELDGYWYYVYEDGRIASPFINGGSGLNCSAVPALAGCSAEKSCGELALMLYPVFTGEELDKAEIDRLADEGIYTIFCENTTLIANVPGIAFSNLYANEELSYSVS